MMIWNRSSILFFGDYSAELPVEPMPLIQLLGSPGDIEGDTWKIKVSECLGEVDWLLVPDVYRSDAVVHEESKFINLGHTFRDIYRGEVDAKIKGKIANTRDTRQDYYTGKS